MSYCKFTNSASHPSNCYQPNALVCPQQEHGHVRGLCYRQDPSECSRTEHTHSSGSPCRKDVGPLCGGDV